MQKSKVRGFTLIEIGIVLLIAAAIVFAAVRLGGGKNVESQANTEAVLIADLITSSQKATQAGATLTATSDFIAAKVFPTAWPVTGSGASATIANSFGGAVTAATAAGIVTLTLNGIPTAACQNMVPVLGQNPAVDTISVAGTSVKASGAALVYTTMSTQCAASNSATIITTYRLK